MFMGPRNWFQGMNSASLCSLAGRYDIPIPPRFLAPHRFFKNSSAGGEFLGNSSSHLYDVTASRVSWPWSCNLNSSQSFFITECAFTSLTLCCFFDKTEFRFPIWRAKTSFCQKRYGSLYDWSLERERSVNSFKNCHFTAHDIMESLSEFGLQSTLIHIWI